MGECPWLRAAVSSRLNTTMQATKQFEKPRREAATARSRGHQPMESEQNEHHGRETVTADLTNMSSFTKLTYHIVFGTKYRRPTISDSIQEQLYEYIGGIIRSKNGALVQIGGVADHLHVLARLSPSISVSDVVRNVKSGSSKWVYELKSEAMWQGWQKGYGAFTVGYPQSESVSRYIQNQAEHHREKTFQEEFSDFLKRHNIEYDPRYLFEDEHHG